jgi:hypothetical protein
MTQSTRTETIASLKETWSLMFMSDAPDDGQFAIWLMNHEMSIVNKAIGITASKCRKLDGQMTLGHAIRFASSVMNRLDQEAVGSTNLGERRNEANRTCNTLGS